VALNAILASGEVQLGNMFTPFFGTYMEGLFGIGGEVDIAIDIGAGGV